MEYKHAVDVALNLGIMVGIIIGFIVISFIDVTREAYKYIKEKREGEWRKCT